MKIVHVYDEHYRVSPEKGSVAKVIYNLATTQSQLGHDVTVIERKWSGLPKNEQREGVKFKRFSLSIGSDTEGEEIPYNQIKSAIGVSKLVVDRFELALKLRSHFGRTDYDVIHFHVPFTANILVHICPQLRDKIVYTAHVGEEDVRFGLSKQGLISRALAMFSPDLHLMRRTAASSVLNKRLAAQLPLEQIETIPNGVDISEYSPENSDLVDLNDRFGIESPFALFVGTLTPRKGPDVLLDAVSILDQKYNVNQFSIVIAGNPNIEEDFSAQLKEQAEAQDVTVHFPGFIELEELKALYANCELFALPSHEEGWGMVITEAMSSESPIIATNVSGIPEQVVDGENGFLIEPDNSEQLAEKLQVLIDDPDLREEMGSVSRSFAVEKFSWESVSEKYLSMYKSTSQ
ncbi:glycosyltransferase family 4 protein [Haloferax sulfurifontis]|uniref:Glycosyl transferase n=1 Tax=Haloferax sulfurifontis TaxID=255616 RepID=A0A830E450_9EURY|nr:glycosyltransferase family 4 protein [Haloferax sulfurifontis]GGC48720.1 glycosyl transferase [Haloferax sulfurifontis]